MKLKFTDLIPWLCVAVVCLASYVFLYTNNADVFFMVQLRSFFNSGAQFWHTCMGVPGGALAWLGCWFTQLFYHTWIGITALTAIWVVTFFAIKFAYGIKNAWSSLILIPIACMVVSVIDLGYWIYYFKQPGLYFRESLGLLCVALLVLIDRVGELPKSPAPGIKPSLFSHLAHGLSAVIAAAAYPLIGYFSPLALLSIAIRHALNRRWTDLGVAALLLVASPLIFLQFYDNYRPEDAFTIGFPVFDSLEMRSTELSYPFAIAALSLLLFNVRLKWKAHPAFAWAALVALIGGSGYAVSEADFTDPNYHAECKMYRHVDHQEWEKVLDVARAIPGDATREIVMLKNIALFNLGTVGDDMYHYSDKGMKPYTRDSLHVHLAQTAAPIIYLHHGKTNYAYRWCMENTVEFGLTVNDLKIMTQSCLVSGEYEVADKYLDLLSRTMYYKGWAERYRLLTSGKKEAKEFTELRNILELYSHMGSILDSDNGICEMYLLNYFAGTMNKDSKYLQEMTLAYSMMKKDIPTFWPHFFLYAHLHQGKEMPIHYQEAAYLYGVLEPQTVDISGMPFDKERVIDRYARFSQVSQQLLASGMSPDQVGVQMESEFGDTFWWSYFFIRGQHTY